MTQTETDINLVISYIEANSDFKPSKEMINAMSLNGKLDIFQMRTWNVDDAIVGLRVFMKTLCPFQNAQGWALTLDLSNGHPIDLDLGLNKN